MQILLRKTTAYKRLLSDAERDELSHAVLVLFPDGALLRPLLKECAKAILGARDGSRTAKLIDEESYSDCVFYPAEGEKLTADLAARILEEAALSPVEGKRKLFVLDGFHTVTPLVQNKLLKVLEEPFESVVFLIGATASSAVLPTVLSRVKKLEEPPFSEEEIARALARNHAGEEGIPKAAAASGGIYSVAEKLLAGGDEFALAVRLLSEENYVALCRECGNAEDKRALLSALKLTLRDALFYAAGQQKYAAIHSEEMESLGREYPAGALLEGIRLVGEAEKQIQFNANYAQALLTLIAGIRREKIKWQKLS